MDDGRTLIEMDDRLALSLRREALCMIDQHKDLNYHLFSILAVSMWGSYETYVYMLFEELFEKQPRMLKADETITFKEIIDNKKNIELYVSERTLKRIGHFNFKDSTSYLSKKISFRYAK